MVKISAQDIFIAQSSATRKPNGFDSRLFLRFYLFPFLLSFRKGINDIRITKMLRSYKTLLLNITVLLKEVFF